MKSDVETSEAPRVSVVIPVYNDAGPLAKCLEALEHQTHPESSFRVNVVDNDSEEDIGAVVDSFECARLLFEAQPGSYAARNRGIRETDGDVLAFTDADCVPAETWIEEGVRHLTGEPACDLVGGGLDFSFRTENRPSPPEFFDATHYLDQKKYVREGKFAATANAFAWRRLFEEVGLFDASRQSGGDTEWGKRVHRCGYRICYADSARVQHPARHTYAALRRKKLRVVEGTTQARKERGYPLRELAVDVVKDIGHHVKFAVHTAIDERYSGRELAEAIVAFPYQGAASAAKRIEGWLQPLETAQ
jgi:glycosyltransferase involved in cell wall biosynthesis